MDGARTKARADRLVGGVRPSALCGLRSRDPFPVIQRGLMSENACRRPPSTRPETPP